MTKTILALILTSALLCTILSASNLVSYVHGETFQGWEIKNFGSGHLAAENGIIRLWSDAPNQGITLFKEILPVPDFEFSLQLKAARSVGFGIIVGTKVFATNDYEKEENREGVNLEFSNRYGSNFFYGKIC